MTWKQLELGRIIHLHLLFRVFQYKNKPANLWQLFYLVLYYFQNIQDQKNDVSATPTRLYFKPSRLIIFKTPYSVFACHSPTECSDKPAARSQQLFRILNASVVHKSYIMQLQCDFTSNHSWYSVRRTALILFVCGV